MTRDSLAALRARAAALESAAALRVFSEWLARDARAGALALMRAWSRSAMARSGAGISAIFESTSRSPASWSFDARASASEVGWYGQALLMPFRALDGVGLGCRVMLVIRSRWSTRIVPGSGA